MIKDEKRNMVPINYSVIGATSEDPEHPLYSIISRDRNEGWCSASFC